MLKSAGPNETALKSYVTHLVLVNADRRPPHT